MSQQINLFNPRFRKRGFSLGSATAMLYAAGIAVAAAALIAVDQEHQLRDVQARAQVMEQAHGEARANHEKLVAELAKSKPGAQLAAEIAALDTQLSERQEVIAALKGGAIGNTDGFSSYLRAFSRQSISGLWLTGFDIAFSGNALALRGRTLGAEHVAEYLKRLNQEESMQGRQFAAMRISQPPPASATAPVAATAPAKSAVERNDRTARGPTAPRYLEFMISTLDIADGAQAAMNAATSAPPLLGSLSAAARVDPAPAAGGQAGAR